MFRVPNISPTSIFFLLTLFPFSLLLFSFLLFISPYCRKFDFQTSFDHDLINAYSNLIWPRQIDDYIGDF